MNKKFMQNILNTIVFKKLTTVFPLLKKEKIEDEEIKQVLKSFEKEGIISAIEASDQDVQELAGMILEAFDESVEIIRQRLNAGLDLIVAELKKK